MMRKNGKYQVWIICTAALILLGAGGCSGSDAPPAPPTPPVPALPSPTAPPAPVDLPKPTAVKAPSDALHQKLIGTRWMLSDFEIEFLDAQKLRIKGGPLRNLAPAGLEVPYVYKEGAFDVKALGQTRKGSWNGEQLTIDGATGQKL